MTDTTRRGGGLHLPPFAGTTALTGSQAAPDPPADDDYPPIEQFLDELPSIDDFLFHPEWKREPEQVTPATSPMPATRQYPPAAPEQDAEGWAIAGWQSYDWSGLTALSRPAAERAAGSAADTKWGWSDEQSAGTAGASADRAAEKVADEIAAALDQVARRIRSGELPIEQLRSMPPEAAIAAALAVLLRTRTPG